MAAGGGLELGQLREDQYWPLMPARGQSLEDSQARVCEEFLMASSGNLRLCSFCGFSFFPSFFHHWVVRAGLFLFLHIIKATPGPGRAGKNNSIY